MIPSPSAVGTYRARFGHPALRLVVPRGGIRGGYVNQLRTARGLCQQDKPLSPIESLPRIGAALRPTAQPAKPRSDADPVEVAELGLVEEHIIVAEVARHLNGHLTPQERIRLLFAFALDPRHKALHEQVV